MDSKSDVWSGHLAAWRGRGLTQAAYCGQCDLSLACFGYWHRKLGKGARTSSPALVPILIDEERAAGNTIEVCLPNGLHVRLPVEMEPSRWAPMMRALRAC